MRSAPKTHSLYNGYVEPTEMAFQMFEDALEPFLDEWKKGQKWVTDEELREVKKTAMSLKG